MLTKLNLHKNTHLVNDIVLIKNVLSFNANMFQRCRKSISNYEKWTRDKLFAARNFHEALNENLKSYSLFSPKVLADNICALLSAKDSVTELFAGISIES